MPAERIMLGVTAALAIVDLVVIVSRGYQADWSAYAAILLFGSVLIGAGGFYRSSARSEEIASALIGTGCYVNFSALAAAFNYVLLPIWRTPIDPALAAIDASLGFHWPDMLSLAASSPLLVEATRYAYMSSIFQFAFIVMLLGLGGRTRDLQQFMLATTLTCLMTLAFWALFPSLGTTSIYNIPAEIEQQVRPILGSRYGEKMLALAASGPTLITPKDVTGLISAPSFHTVMALLALYAVRNIPWVFWPLFPVNMLVLAGTVIHGAHHLTDVAGGVLVTVAGLVAARRLSQVPDQRAIVPAGVSA
jgi:hypothetical protein